jgi:hypothetical protein
LVRWSQVTKCWICSFRSILDPDIGKHDKIVFGAKMVMMVAKIHPTDGCSRNDNCACNRRKRTLHHGRSYQLWLYLQLRVTLANRDSSSNQQPWPATRLQQESTTTMMTLLVVASMRSAQDRRDTSITTASVVRSTLEFGGKVASTSTSDQVHGYVVHPRCSAPDGYRCPRSAEWGCLIPETVRLVLSCLMISIRLLAYAAHWQAIRLWTPPMAAMYQGHPRILSSIKEGKSKWTLVTAFISWVTSKKDAWITRDGKTVPEIRMFWPVEAKPWHRVIPLPDASVSLSIRWSALMPPSM